MLQRIRTYWQNVIDAWRQEVVDVVVTWLPGKVILQRVPVRVRR